MSDEYTPTTVDIKTAWIAHHVEATDESPMPMSRFENDFDRWLARHDADTVMAFANHFLKHEDWKKARKFANDILEGKA